MHDVFPGGDLFAGKPRQNPREELFPLVLALRQIRRDQLHMQQAQEEVAALVAERMRALGWTHAGFTDVGFATIEKDGTLTFAPLES